jgi:hypothetical protein
MPTQTFESRLGNQTDDVYEALIKAHEGLAEADSHALNARLVLLMANEIADPQRLRDLFDTARSYGR